MSGSSYNYLFCHTDNLTEHRGDLEEMADRLTGLGWAPEAAEATRRVLELLDQAQGAAEQLRDVWHAVEWWDSGDWGEDDVREEIAKHRADPTQRPTAGVLVPREAFDLLLRVAECAHLGAPTTPEARRAIAALDEAGLLPKEDGRG